MWAKTKSNSRSPNSELDFLSSPFASPSFINLLTHLSPCSISHTATCLLHWSWLTPASQPDQAFPYPGLLGSSFPSHSGVNDQESERILCHLLLLTRLSFARRPKAPEARRLAWLADEEKAQVVWLRKALWDSELPLPWVGSPYLLLALAS